MSESKKRLLQGRLKKNEKSQNQFKNGLMHIGRIRLKKGQRKDLSQTKKTQNIVNNILQNKIEHKCTTKYTCTSEKKKEIT